MRINKLFVLLIFISFSTQAQLKKWIVREMWGQIHLLDFTTPVPTLSIPANAIGYGSGGDEEVNIMTDQNDNILFTTATNSTNMSEVRDANFNLMPNGNGILDNTSSLNSVVVRKPCSTDKYYFVTFDAITSNLYYSIIDMALNGGLGDVTNKNTLLGPGYTEGACVSHQRITGCRWLIIAAINGNAYDVVKFNVSDVGISSPTVIATVSLSNAAAQPHKIVLSPDNTKLAMTTLTSASQDPDVVVWDFDLEAGTVSNRVDYSVSGQTIFGAEFSPDNTKVYYVGNSGSSNIEFGRIDLTTGISNLITNTFGPYQVHIEAAGNGKIYIGHSYTHQYLSEIANPNAPNIANIGYTENAINMGLGCHPGLPNAVEGELPGSTVTPQYIAFGVVPTANCNEFQFIDTTCLATWWEWNFGDGTFSNIEFPIHQYTVSGTYDITLRIVACGDTLTLTKPDLIQVSISNPVAGFAADSLVCLGDSILFTNNSTGATSYSWDFGDSTFSAAANPTHVYDSTGTYMVILIADNSCTSDTVMQAITVVDSAITANFNFSILNCSTIVNFSSLSAGSTNIVWNFGDGSPSDTGSNPVHNYPSSGTYTVTLIASNACNSDTIQQQVVITALPVATAQFTVSSQPCDSIVAVNNLSQNAVNYHWDFGDGSALDTNVNPVHIYSSSGIYTITLIVSNSCSSDTFQLQVTIIISQQATANFTANSPPCSSTISLINQSQNSSGYQWNFGDGSPLDTTLNPSHTYGANGTYTVTLIAGNICNSDTFQVQVTINIPPLPTSNFTISSQLCSLNITLTNSSLNGTSYQWNFGDGSFSTSISPSHTYASAGIYMVTLITSNNCFSDTIQQQVDLAGAVQPVSDFTFSIPLCDLAVSLTNQSQNTDSVSWDYGDGVTSTLLNPVHIYSAAGIYTITLISFNQCGSDTITKTVIDTFSIGNAMFIISQVPCKSEVQFINQSQNAFSYHWDFGDGNIDTVMNPMHEYLFAGNYTVTLIINEGTLCADTIVRSETINGSDTSNLFVPNCFTPNSDSKNEVLEIKGLNECEIYHLSIYNRWGQAVFETDDIKKFWDGKFKGKNVPGGVYFFVLQGKLISRSGFVTVIR